MIRPIRLLTFFLLCCVSLSFAGPSGEADSSAVSVSESPRVDPVEQALEQEILLRDSLMQVQGEACTAEKDSLRAVIETEKAKSENWEKSYNTVKGSNETCAQALSVSLGVNEKKKEDVEKERQSAAMMTSTSFLGGIGIGLLIMWLIMK